MQLRAHRKAAGLTQEQAAARIDRDAKSISRWENGHRAPDLGDLILMADAYGVSLLLAPAGLPSAPVPGADGRP